MLQLKIVKPVNIIGNQYQAGDEVPVNKTLIHREVAKVASGIQKLLDAGSITEVSTDTYKVVSDIEINTRGLIYGKNDQFKASKVFDYEDIVDYPSWVQEGVADGLWTLDDGIKHVTGVTVAPTTFSIQVGATQALTATIAPADAADKTGAWSSSDATIATVDASGVVTAVKVGSATITFTSTDGAKTAVATATVTAATVAVTSVAVGPTSPTAAVGATVQLNANVSPAGATDKSGVWSSSDETIATVDQSGLVTGVAAGSATISFTTTDGAKKGNRAVTITAAA